MDNTNCGTCRCAHIRKREDKLDDDHINAASLPDQLLSVKCRRYPPTSLAGWPWVLLGDWCGEWQPILRDYYYVCDSGEAGTHVIKARTVNHAANKFAKHLNSAVLQQPMGHVGMIDAPQIISFTLHVSDGTDRFYHYQVKRESDGYKVTEIAEHSSS